MIKTGVIGYGYWGPNVVRNFNSSSDIKVLKICDKNKDRREIAGQDFPNIKIVGEADDIIRDKDISAAAIVTPVFTHYDLAKKLLLNGKHIFIEKPFTSNTKQADELIEIAERKNLTIMVDHTFLFTGAVKKIKQIIEEGILGNLYYYDSVRVNLGLFQHDINVIWDLIPHDISILNYVLGDLKPVSVNVAGCGHFKRGIEDVAYLNIKFENDFNAHFHANWLSPVKVRKTLIAGDKNMLVWNDLETDEKIKIYDRGVDIETQEGIYSSLAQYRLGGMISPKVETMEALKVETKYFADCLKNGRKPFNDGIAGRKVVRILEASDISLKNDGNAVKL